MAFTTIIRRTTSSLLPRTIRATGFQRNYSSAILKNSNTTKLLLSKEIYRGGFVSTFNNLSSLAKESSNSDHQLVGIIDSEIKCAEESQAQDSVDGIPDEFPFEIQDEPGKRTISLERQYQGEIIKVEVHIPEIDEGENEEEEDDENKEEENSESDGKPNIAIVVGVSKGKNKPSLEFGCTAYPDEIIIDSLTVNDPNISEDDLAYEGPEFLDLDENLQKGFYKYLADRGIKPSTTNFLYEYMINKDSKEYLMWLKNVKYFVEK